MLKAEWTPQARTELKKILKFIAKKGRPLTAERLYDEIHEKAEFYARTPDTGLQHKHMPDEWLYGRFKRWAIVFERTDKGIKVLRVIDFSRDFDKLF